MVLYVLSFLVVVQYDLVFHTKVEIVTCLTLSKKPNNHLSFCLPSCPVLALSVQCGRHWLKSEIKFTMSPYNSLERWYSFFFNIEITKILTFLKYFCKMSVFSSQVSPKDPNLLLEKKLLKWISFELHIFYIRFQWMPNMPPITI